MRGDTDFDFPFKRIVNPFQSDETAIWIGILSLVLILLDYSIGKKLTVVIPSKTPVKMITTKNIISF